jgi:O-antigen ligase
MGFLGLLLVIFATFLNTFFKFQRYGKNEGRRKLLSFVVFLIVLSLIFIGSLRWLPFFENAFISRFDYLVNSFIQVKEMISNGNDLSAQAPARYKLFLQSVYGFMDNLPFGIGYANVRTYMGETLGTGTYVHNTYMEYLLMGGVFGLAMVLYSTFLICRAILVSIKNLSHPFAENILAFTLVGMFVLLFLSINESIIPVIIIALNLIVFDNLREVCE